MDWFGGHAVPDLSNHYSSSDSLSPSLSLSLSLPLSLSPSPSPSPSLSLPPSLSLIDIVFQKTVLYTKFYLSLYIRDFYGFFVTERRNHFAVLMLSTVSLSYISFSIVCAVCMVGPALAEGVICKDCHLNTSQYFPILLNTYPLPVFYINTENSFGLLANGLICQTIY